MTTRDRSQWGRPPHTAVSPTLFTVIVAAFFLPFGAGAIGGCEGGPTVEFTGVQLATWRIEQVAPKPARTMPAVEEAVADYESENSTLAAIAIGAALVGAALGIARRGRPGICVTVGTVAIIWLGASMTGSLDLWGPTVEALVGYEVALGTYLVLVVWHLALVLHRRRRRKRGLAANDTSRLAPSIR